MTFLKTLLVSAAVCAGLLAAAIHAAGYLPVPNAHAGLTAADILGTDGTPPADASQAEISRDLDRDELARIAADASAAVSSASGNGDRG